MTKSYISRAGIKLEKALQHFAIDVKNKVCMDVGAATGGFTDCLLQHGTAKVYAIETGYGVLDWKLRNDPRVIAKERSIILALIKPQYEIHKKDLKKGIVPEEKLVSTVNNVRQDLQDLGFKVSEIIESPITGESGNHEFWVKVLK